MEFLSDLLPECYNNVQHVDGRILLLLHVLGHSPNEQVGVEVEAVCAARTLALDVRLVVHAEHGVAPVASHHQLMPAALVDWHFADHRACP